MTDKPTSYGDVYITELVNQIKQMKDDKNIHDLEKIIDDLTQQVKFLKEQNLNLQEEIRNLQAEVEYERQLRIGGAKYHE